MGSEHLNWILENVNAFILKEETKTDLPSWKTDINNDFGEDLIKFEDDVLLSPLVRLTYLRHLRNSLKTNYLQCQKGFKDCSDMIVNRIENCAVLMEQKALRLCMLANYYQRTMSTIIMDIKNLTNNNLLHKELGRCLCSDYLSLREDKNVQADIRPFRMSRSVQTSDHRPWTETNLDTNQVQRITKSNRRNSQNDYQRPHPNEISSLNSSSNAVSTNFSPVKPLNSRKRTHDLSGNPPSHATNFGATFKPCESSYDAKGQGAIVKKIIDDYSSSFSDVEDSSSFSKKAKSVPEESKTYDSLDDRLQALFADDPPCDSEEPVDVPMANNHHKPWKNVDEIVKDLCGTDNDDDFPLDSQEIEELSRDLDNEEEPNCFSQSPAVSESKEKRVLIKSSPNYSEMSAGQSTDRDFSGIEFEEPVKAHFIPWLSERVARLYSFNSAWQRLPADKRRSLEKKYVALFGPCCMFDNDDLTPEEQKRICRKRIAKLVCHHLRPYFKSKQIQSKDLFQSIARHITEKLLSRHLAADEKMAKKSVQRFFEKNGKIRSIEQLPFDVKPRVAIYDCF